MTDINISHQLLNGNPAVITKMVRLYDMLIKYGELQVQTPQQYLVQHLNLINGLVFLLLTCQVLIVLRVTM